MLPVCRQCISVAIVALLDRYTMRLQRRKVHPRRIRKGTIIRIGAVVGTRQIVVYVESVSSTVALAVVSLR